MHILNKKYSIYKQSSSIFEMGEFGDIIRTVRDTIEGAIKECGVDEIKEEIKDIIDAINGK